MPLAQRPFSLQKSSSRIDEGNAGAVKRKQFDYMLAAVLEFIRNFNVKTNCICRRGDTRYVGPTKIARDYCCECMTDIHLQNQRNNRRTLVVSPTYYPLAVECVNATNNIH